jgi:hypothetical protein
MPTLPAVNATAAGRRIRPEMTVREISQRFPTCRAVFAQHGMGGCGGEHGPDEPLEFFAAAHRVDLCCLLAALECAAASDANDAVSPMLDFEKRLARLHRAFIKAAIGITLTFGTAWGAHILGIIALRQSFDAPNYAGTQAHGHAQIYGWVGLFILGVAYFSLPKILNAKLRSLAMGWTVFGLMLTGILLRAVAQPLAERPLFGLLAVISAALELAAVGLFVFDVGRLFAANPQPEPRYERFLLASLTSLVALAAWNLALVVPLWLQHGTVVPDPANSRFLYLAVFGFIGNMILGYSLRLLPIFLGLRPTRAGLILPAFLLFNAGVVARVFVPSLRDGLAAGLLTAAGVALYIVALRIFEPAADEAKTRGVDASFPWFVRLAYLWFAAAVAMVLGGDLYAAWTGAPPAHLYTGAWRHAITVGFITTLMVGLGYRLLPLFAGADLWRPGWFRVSFWLLAIGNTLRVGFQLATASGERAAFLLMGVSGVLELTAIALFGVSMFKTLGRRPVLRFTTEQISPRTHVRWLLDNFPQARAAMIQAGLRHLEKAPVVPYFVTLEQAAAVHGLEVEPIVARLRESLRKASS